MDTLLIKYSIEGWKRKDCCTSLRPLKPLPLLWPYPHITSVKIFLRGDSLHQYAEVTSSCTIQAPFSPWSFFGILDITTPTTINSPTRWAAISALKTSLNLLDSCMNLGKGNITMAFVSLNVVKHSR